ncbi:MAG: hypothetical protein DLM55_04015 [Acidimicrobiales bacterium]|nr:MAG: hypothetical protein DLM55_04015 [Acidimicrobiales bacterium]
MTADPPPVLWRPEAGALQDSSLARFSRWITQRHDVEFADHAALHAWSIQNLAEFWAGIAERVF